MLLTPRKQAFFEDDALLFDVLRCLWLDLRVEDVAFDRLANLHSGTSTAVSTSNRSRGDLEQIAGSRDFVHASEVVGEHLIQPAFLLSFTL